MQKYPMKYSYIYHSISEPEEGLQEGEAQIQIGRMITLFQVVSTFRNITAIDIPVNRRYPLMD